MLRQIESSGYIVTGLDEEPKSEKDPIRLKCCSQGIDELYNLFLKSGHHVVRSTEPLDALKTVQE